MTILTEIKRENQLTPLVEGAGIRLTLVVINGFFERAQPEDDAVSCCRVLGQIFVEEGIENPFPPDEIVFQAARIFKISGREKALSLLKSWTMTEKWKI